MIELDSIVRDANNTKTWAVAGACYSSAGRGIVALLDYWEVW
jgi:hypothetical protein